MIGFSTEQEIIARSEAFGVVGVVATTAKEPGELMPEGESRKGLGVGLLMRMQSSRRGLFLGDLCNPFPNS